jgi:hypothetical protein
MTASTNDQTVASKAPTHSVSQVRNINGKSYWTRIGSAWAHKNGTGFNIQLDAVPLDGRLVVSAIPEKSE